MKGGIGLGTIFNGYSAATSADGIPLDTFTPAGQQAFVALFAALGFSQVMLNLIGVLVLVRYRAMIPFMFALLLFEHLGRRLIFWVLPIPRTGTPPGMFINLALVALMLVGLALSLKGRDEPGSRA
jgi:ABC-type sugar transport system permease subunit